MRLGEINERMFVINSCDGLRKQISEMPLVLPTPSVDEESDLAPRVEEMADEPSASGMAIDVQDRIRDLEQTLSEERRALRELEERYRALEGRRKALPARVT